MSRLRVPPSVYGVAWDADRIVKIGFSEYQRWRHFIGRGGRVIFVRQFAEFHSAITAEGVCHDLLRSLSFACPFRSAIDAEPYMGRGGGGWRECYAMTAEDALRAMDAVCPTALGAHAPSMWVAGALAMPRARNGRTDGLTENHSPTGDHLSVGTAYARIRRSRRLGAVRGAYGDRSDGVW